MTATSPNPVPAATPCTPCEEALARQAWAAHITVAAFGVRFAVRVDDAALLPKVRRHLPPGSRVSRSGPADQVYSLRAGGLAAGSRMRRFYLGYSGGARFVRTLDEAEALAAFESVVRFDVSVAATRWLFVHAGAVGWKGRGIVIPAASGSGKSRLVEALVRAGATYYSDEAAVLDARGRLLSFAKAIALRDESGGTRFVTAEEIGGTIGADALPIGLIVTTRYQQGETWSPRRVAPGEAVLALLANTARARIAPGPTLRRLARAAHRAVALEGPRGDARRTADDLLRFMDAPPP